MYLMGAYMTFSIVLYTVGNYQEQYEELLKKYRLEKQLSIHSYLHKPHQAPCFEAIKDADAVIGEFMPVYGDTVELFKASNVKALASMSIGLNHIDVEGLGRSGIKVFNCPGYCSYDVALHSLALMLDLQRQISSGYAEVLRGRWSPRYGYEMHRPKGQTLGLVFFGSIARSFAPLAQAIGMKVQVWAPTKTQADLDPYGCRYVSSLNELLSTSDVVSLHCPLIDSTRHLLSFNEFKRMKRSAFLINTSRGAVVDEEALAWALAHHEIAGAAVDVLEHETRVHESPLLHAPNCIITPHSAYLSHEADAALVHMTFDSLRKFLLA